MPPTRPPPVTPAVDPSVFSPFMSLLEPLDAKELYRRRELADLKPSTTFLEDRGPPAAAGAAPLAPPPVAPRSESRPPTLAPP